MPRGVYERKPEHGAAIKAGKQQRRAQAQSPENAARFRVLRDLDSDKRLARQGDFHAYLRINNLCGSSSTAYSLSRSGMHHRMIQTFFADLICQKCGEFHLADNTFAVVVGGEFTMPPVTCRRCGAGDCAGERRHGAEVPRGGGKSELLAKGRAFRVGLAAHRGRPITGMVLGANQKEAYEKLAGTRAEMGHDAHLDIFNKSVLRRSAAGSLAIHGQNRTAFVAYGIMGIPPGHHPDEIDADDINNATNTMLKPAEMPKVWNEWANVVENSVEPWTVINFAGTPWRAGDTGSKLRTMASANRTVVMDRPLRIEDLKGAGWKWLVFAAGGPPNFESHWAEKWTPEALRTLHAVDSRAYERAFMLRELTDSEIAFRDIQFYWQQPPKTTNLSPQQMAQLIDLPRLSQHASSLDWPKMIGYDPAAIGEAGRGRSKHGFSVVMLNPTQPLAYVLWSREDFMAPEDVKGEILRLCLEYRTRNVAFEQTGLGEEIKRFLIEHDVTIYPYSPAGHQFGGSKEYRKQSLADAVNEGRLRLKGVAKFLESNTGRVGVMPSRGQDVLYEAMRIFPSKQSDALDALEIAIRTLWFQFGAYPLAGAEHGTRIDDSSERFFGLSVPKRGADTEGDSARAEAEILFPCECETVLASADWDGF